MWEAYGIEGRSDDPPLIADSYKGCRAIILGGAQCVWNDWRAAMDLSEPDSYHLVAINDVGQYVNAHIEHWISLHHSYFPGWLNFRRGHARNKPHIHSHRDNTERRPGENRVDWWWWICFGGGTSGLFAAVICVLLGYDRIILAGLPMDNSPHFFDPPWYAAPGTGDDQHKFVWPETKQRCLGDRVRSMSGRTSKWLGSPSEEWWNGRKT